MSLVIKKVRGVNNTLSFQYDDGVKIIAWQIETDDVDVEQLRDIVNTVAPPPLLATRPAYPVGLLPEYDLRVQLADGWNEIKAANTGAEAADQAARAEEQRLMNMGAAINKGVGMAPEDIPVVNGDAGDQLPPVNWNA